jgi:hypothetical protein
MQLFRSGVVCFRGSGPSGINNREGRVGRDLCSALRLRLCKNVERLKFLRGGPGGPRNRRRVVEGEREGEKNDG